MIRFLAWLIFATWLGRKLLGWLFGEAARRPGPGRAESTGSSRRPDRQLHRDPVCGTHVTEGISITLEHDGQVHHFCSTDCRERFRATHANRSSA